MVYCLGWMSYNDPGEMIEDAGGGGAHFPFRFSFNFHWRISIQVLMDR